jgi:hypothetical protein
MRTTARSAIVIVLLSLSVLGCELLESVVPDPSTTDRPPALPSPSLEIPPPR